MAATGLREDFDGLALRRLARRSGHAGQTRRLLALASIYDGGTRTEAARLGGVTLQVVRDWVLRFNARGPEGLIDGKAKGRAPALNAEQLAALAALVEAGPNPAVEGIVRWRQIDLMAWAFEAFGARVSQPAMSRALRALGFRRLSARPRHHAQKPEAAAAFKKTSPPAWRRSRRGKASR